MNERPETTPTVFDPYGETLACGSACPLEAGESRARRAAIVLFWSLALLLVAGRVYVAGEPFGQGTPRLTASAATTTIR
ncbi:hypothetical protein [Methylobacterium nodulans]|uniref:Uncharacterized protein n=1 Tax=Methylobacterium nodulans (strain LMG 21967 / CNCM I-2342 / ORS 2060) TaxID=460265 RepID=B8ID46_METNO|nr:hypothetical protein [Methylobacterium nodulans]ACL59438.1 conserved hypothetical protein [Methylobacterium nodulans ORS 2060]